MEKEITKRQKDLLSVIYQYIEGTGYPPTFEEMREELGVSSNQSIIGLLDNLEKIGIVKRSEGMARGITILPKGHNVLDRPPLAAFLGMTTAGMPSEAIEITGEWQSIPGDVAKLKNEVILLKVSGDSMVNAGIDDEDVVLVEARKEFKSGDIVLAQVDGDSTIKRFVRDDKPPFVYLKPENPKYENIVFTEKVRLSGKVISVMKKKKWHAVK